MKSNGSVFSFCVIGFILSKWTQSFFYVVSHFEFDTGSDSIDSEVVDDRYCRFFLETTHYK
jgi:hypothetical protein